MQIALAAVSKTSVSQGYDLKKAVYGFVTAEGKIEIRDGEVGKPIPQELLDKVNSQ